MKLEYNLTIDDVREAIAPVGSNGAPPPRGRSMVRVLLGWISIACMILCMGALCWVTATSDAGVESINPWNLWVTLVPSLLPAVLFFTAFIFSWFNRRWETNDPLVSRRRSHTLTAVLFLEIAGLVMLTLLDSLALYVKFPRAVELMICFAPWIVMTFVFVFSNATRRRTTAERAIRSTPGLLRIQRLEISDDGVFADDGVSKVQRSWAFFVRYRESPNLILLRNEENRELAILKRALPDPSELDQLKRLIQSNVADGRFMQTTQAFPVIAPRPVLAIES
jgi:hypothetical protein